MAQLVRILEMISMMLAPLQASALAIRPMLDFFDGGCRDRGELPSGVTNSTDFLRDFVPRSFFCPLRLSSEWTVFSPGSLSKLDLGVRWAFLPV